MIISTIVFASCKKKKFESVFWGFPFISFHPSSPVVGVGVFSSSRSWGRLVNFLLFIHAELAGTHVYQQQETADDGEDLEEVVFREVFVRVMLV